MSDDSFETSQDTADGSGTALEERPLFTIDGVSYPIESLPETIAALINDLLRFSQEQNELQFRLRQLQAAQQTYVAVIKQELDAQGVVPLDTSDPVLEAEAA
jgi:hypothetical protein